MTSSEIKDYYHILSIPHHATTFEIERAYEKLINQWHPEKHKHSKQAEEKFHQINEAFEILSNRNSRAHYDEIFHKGYSVQEAERNFNSFFKEHDYINNQERQFFESYYPESQPKKKKDYYNILGVSKNASLQEIKNAYRIAAIKNHPKKVGTDKQALQNFKLINEAYEVLSNEKKKTSVDTFFDQKIGNTKSHDIFESHFGVKPFEFPKEQEFFKPIFKKKWSRNLDRMMDDDFDFKEMQNNAETMKQSTVRTTENGLETKKMVKTRVRINNGKKEQSKIEEYIFPNGERNVVKTIQQNGNITQTQLQLGKGQKIPIEYTF